MAAHSTDLAAMNKTSIKFASWQVRVANAHSISYTYTSKNDQHDAIGVELRFASEHSRGSRLEEQHQRDAPTAKRQEVLQLGAQIEAARTSASQPGGEVTQRLEQQLRDHWENTEEEAEHPEELREILFATRKHACPEDIQIPGVSHPGEAEYVEAVVSREEVIRRLQEVIAYGAMLQQSFSLTDSSVQMGFGFQAQFSDAVALQNRSILLATKQMNGNDDVADDGGDFQPTACGASQPTQEEAVLVPLTLAMQGPAGVAWQLVQDAGCTEEQTDAIALLADSLQKRSDARPDKTTHKLPLATPQNNHRVVWLGGGGVGKTVQGLGPRGRTLHATNSLLMTDSLQTAQLRLNARTQKKMDRLVGQTGIAVIDELGCVHATLLHADALRTTYGRSLRYSLDTTKYMQPQQAWGCLPVKLLCGDFYQLPPVPASASLLTPGQGRKYEHQPPRSGSASQPAVTVQLHDAQAVQPSSNQSGSASQPAAGPVNSLEQGFVHAGCYYAGVAARRPVFIPPDDFFIPQPQLWTQCACPNHCYVCVYDGASLCEGCEPSALRRQTLDMQCDCEPGCCDALPSDFSDSCDEGAAQPAVWSPPDTLCVQDFGLHMFSMCQFGGHKQGLEDASIDYRNMKVFQAGRRL